MGPPTFGNPIVFVSKSIHPRQHWCYLFRGASEQLKSWKRGRRLKYFASEMKIFCSGDEKSLIGCTQPRWSSQYSEGQIFIIGYRKRILKVQKDWKVTITVVLAGCRNLKYKKQEKVANIFAIPVVGSAAALAVHCNRVDLGSVQLKSLDHWSSGPAPLRDLMLRSLFKIHGWPSQYAPPGRPGGGLMRTNDFMSEVFSFKLTAKQEVWLPVCQ